MPSEEPSFTQTISKESRVFSISYSKVDDVKKFLKDLSSKRGSIISDSRNKQLIIKDVPSVLDQMAEMVKRVDRPERQVMIEARIVEADDLLGVRRPAILGRARSTAAPP